MNELRVGDVVLRERGFTLYPAAEELNVDINCMNTLLFAAENKSDISNLPDKREDIPLWPLSYTKDELSVMYKSSGISELLAEGLITQEGTDTFCLTQKAIEVFKRAKEIDQKLKSERFHFCPCHFR